MEALQWTRDDKKDWFKQKAPSERATKMRGFKASVWSFHVVLISFSGIFLICYHKLYVWSHYNIQYMLLIFFLNSASKEQHYYKSSMIKLPKSQVLFFSKANFTSVCFPSVLSNMWNMKAKRSNEWHKSKQKEAKKKKKYMVVPCLWIKPPLASQAAWGVLGQVAVSDKRQLYSQATSFHFLVFYLFSFPCRIQGRKECLNYT